MHTHPEDTVYILRAQAHTSLMRTIHNKRVVKRSHLHKNRGVFAAFLPLVIAGNALLYDYTHRAVEQPAHAAAPTVAIEDSHQRTDETLEEQREMVAQVCSSICWNERISRSSDQMVYINFCTDVCGISYEEPIALPETSVVNAYNDLIEIAPNAPAVELQLQQAADDIQHSLTAVEERIPTSPHSQIGIYSTQNSTATAQTFRDLIRGIRDSGGNAIVVDVKGSFVYFGTRSQFANEHLLVKPLYDLEEIVSIAHENDLTIIARYIVAKDPSLASKIPETQIRNSSTGKGIGDTWVSPNHHLVLQYNAEILQEVVASGVDEITFDYIRYPTEYSQDAIGLSGRQKADALEEFLQMARDIVTEKNSATKLGISTYAILGWNFPVNLEPLGQDIPRLSKLVDVVSPMAYPSTFSANAYFNPLTDPGPRSYYLVYRTLMGYKDLLGEDFWKIRPWIQGYYMTKHGMQSQMQAVFDAGLCGFTVWSSSNVYTETFSALGKITIPRECL